MAETSRERQGEMLRAVFNLLTAHPDGLSSNEVIARAEKAMILTDDEKSSYPNSPGVRKFDNRLRFATIASVKAGWLIKANGIWLITPEGIAANAKFSDPGDLMRESARLYRVWKSSLPDVDIDEVDDEDKLAHSAATRLEGATESARSDIHSFLASMPPYDFQELIAGLMRAMGYYVQWIAPPGRDGGVDIVAFTDPLGATGPRIKVQVKRWTTSKIGVDGLRSFLAVLGAQDVGVFVSLAGFSSDAEAEARVQDNRRLLLIDEDRLVKMWIDYHDRLTERDRSRLPLEPVYFLSPTD
jgi:restriction system protein